MVNKYGTTNINNTRHKHKKIMNVLFSPLEMLTSAGTGKESQWFEHTFRDSWWIGDLRDTPIPGSYDLPNLIDQLDNVTIKKTYGFKSSGRKTRADPSRHGEYLMPGLYSTKDFLDSSKINTYNFKSVDRNNKHGIVVGIQDQQILNSDLGPMKYAEEFSVVKKMPSKHAAFKSQSARFPTIYFKPKEGPSPTKYKASEKRSVSIASPFSSKTPRFKNVHILKTPGPGAYTKMIQYPMPKHIRQVGRDYGVFFPPGV